MLLIRRRPRLNVLVMARTLGPAVLLSETYTKLPLEALTDLWVLVRWVDIRVVESLGGFGTRRTLVVGGGAYIFDM